MVALAAAARSPRLVETIAYAFAGAIDLERLVACFSGAHVRSARKQVVIEQPDGRVAVGFAFGALVLFGYSAEERARVLGSVLSHVAITEKAAPLHERLLLEIGGGSETQKVAFDRVVLAGIDEPTIETIALLLAQSACIDRYLEDVDALCEELDDGTHRMACTGRLPVLGRSLVRFVGETVNKHNQILDSLAVLEKPPRAWESERLDLLSRKLRERLEIEPRFGALEHKLRNMRATLELYLNLNHTRRATVLEVTIVVLIVVELACSIAEKVF